MKQSRVLLEPIITEKSLEDAKVFNEYTFLVERNATKTQIREAVQKTFDVNVEDVRTAPSRGKTKRVGRRFMERKVPDRKKAVVKLAEKNKIGLFEVEEKKK